MKKMMFLCCALAAALVGTVSCDPAEKDGYEGTNYIYLTAPSQSMYDTEDASLEVTVTLTAALEENLLLSFKSDDQGEIISFEGNPVSIAAGTKSATFKIKAAKLPKFTNSVNYKITLDESSVLPEKVALKEDFAMIVYSSDVPALTEEQMLIVAAYKESNGIDLSKYLGLVKVSVVYSECDPETGEYLTPAEYDAQTKIVLSDKSAQGKPVLKMEGNPMGIKDRMYETLRNKTVCNSYWTDEGAGPEYKTLMEGINWNKDSEETFEMSLDGIELNADGIVFTAEETDSYGDPITIVPFEYSFSAYEREKVAELDIAEGSDATANPSMHLNVGDIMSDAYTDGDGLWVAPSSSISADKMTFVFCIDCDGSDYIKVEATYTPNK